jgi:hypothetical protein
MVTTKLQSVYLYAFLLLKARGEVQPSGCVASVEGDDGPLETLHPTLLDALDLSLEDDGSSSDGDGVVDTGRVPVNDFLSQKSPTVDEVDRGRIERWSRGQGGRGKRWKVATMSEEREGDAGRVGSGGAETGAHWKGRSRDESHRFTWEIEWN